MEEALDLSFDRLLMMMSKFRLVWPLEAYVRLCLCIYVILWISEQGAIVSLYSNSVFFILEINSPLCAVRPKVLCRIDMFLISPGSGGLSPASHRGG